jgi:hypothetical protein
LEGKPYYDTFTAMTYEELVDFLERKMSMSHVYQPLLVRALVDAGGEAPFVNLHRFFSRRTKVNSCTTRSGSRKCP